MRAVIPWHRRQRGVGVQTHPFFESRRILLAPLRVVSSRATTRSQNGVMTSSTDCDGSDSKSTSRLPTKPATATRVGVTRELLAQTALSLLRLSRRTQEFAPELPVAGDGNTSEAVRGLHLQHVLHRRRATGTREGNKRAHPRKSRVVRFARKRRAGRCTHMATHAST